MIGCGLTMLSSAHLHYLRESATPGSRLRPFATKSGRAGARLRQRLRRPLSSRWQDLIDSARCSADPDLGEPCADRRRRGGCRQNTCRSRNRCGFSVAEGGNDRRRETRRHRPDGRLQQAVRPAYRRLCDEMRTVRICGCYVTTWNRRCNPMSRITGCTSRQASRQGQSATAFKRTIGSASRRRSARRAALARHAYHAVLLGQHGARIQCDPRRPRRKPDRMGFSHIRDGGLTTSAALRGDRVHRRLGRSARHRPAMNGAFYAPEPTPTLSFPSPFLRSCTDTA